MVEMVAAISIGLGSVPQAILHKVRKSTGEADVTNDTPLFVIIVGLAILTTYLIATAPKTTAQERKEMEEEWWD